MCVPQSAWKPTTGWASDLTTATVRRGYHFWNKNNSVYLGMISKRFHFQWEVEVVQRFPGVQRYSPGFLAPWAALNSTMGTGALIPNGCPEESFWEGKLSKVGTLIIGGGLSMSRHKQSSQFLIVLSHEILNHPQKEKDRVVRSSFHCQASDLVTSLNPCLP